MECRKGLVPPGGSTSISQIESELPPLHGEGASISAYFTQLHKDVDRLNSLYNGSNRMHKSHGFDQRRARMEEFRVIVNGILKLNGCNRHWPRQIWKLQPALVVARIIPGILHEPGKTLVIARPSGHELDFWH